MQPIKSTAEILMSKILNHNINKIWIDWATDMLVAGFDTEKLRILAGETEPINQFYAQNLAEQILAELGIDYSDKEQITKNYVSFLIGKSLNGEISNLRALEKLERLYVELDYYEIVDRPHEDLYDFYLLSNAKSALLGSDMQWYWRKDDLTKDNIDEFIHEYFKQYLSKQN